MSGNPLNQAIISQLLFDLRNGQLRRLEGMGLTEEDIKLLKDPEMISVLSNTPVKWATINVNTDIMRRLLNRVQDSNKELAIMDMMLKLGASSKLISEVFALDQRETAFRKRVLGIDKKQGRWSELTEEQDHALWAEWKNKIVQYNLDTNNAMDMAKVCMILAQKNNIPMAMIWQAIEKWIKEIK